MHSITYIHMGIMRAAMHISNNNNNKFNSLNDRASIEMEETSLSISIINIHWYRNKCVRSSSRARQAIHIQREHVRMDFLHTTIK